jgi:hypothetical protein
MIQQLRTIKIKKQKKIERNAAQNDGNTPAQFSRRNKKVKTQRQRRKTIKISLSRQSVLRLDIVRTYQKGPWEDQMG